jgi:hypothetical protein
MYSISENTKGNTDSELLRTWRWRQYFGRRETERKLQKTA